MQFCAAAGLQQQPKIQHARIEGGSPRGTLCVGESLPQTLKQVTPTPAALVFKITFFMQRISFARGLG